MVPKASVVNILKDEQPSLFKSKKQQDKRQLNHTDSKKRIYESTSFAEFQEPDINHVHYSENSKYDCSTGIDTKINSEELYLQIQPQYKQSSLLRNSEGNDSDNISLTENDKTSLLPQSSTKRLRSSDFNSNANSTGIKHESAKEICLQTMFPLLMAGLGMVAVGIVLDKVQVMTFV